MSPFDDTPSEFFLGLAALEATMVTVVLAITVFALQIAGGSSSKRLHERLLGKRSILLSYGSLWLVAIANAVFAVVPACGLLRTWFIGIAGLGLLATPFLLWWLLYRVARDIDPLSQIADEKLRFQKALDAARTASTDLGGFTNLDALTTAFVQGDPAAIRVLAPSGQMEVHLDQILDLTRGLIGRGTDPRAFSGLRVLQDALVQLLRNGLRAHSIPTSPALAFAGSPNSVENTFRHMLALQYLAMANHDHATIVEIYDSCQRTIGLALLSDEYKDAPRDIRRTYGGRLCALLEKASGVLSRRGDPDVAGAVLDGLRHLAGDLAKAGAVENLLALQRWADSEAVWAATSADESLRSRARRLCDAGAIECARFAASSAPRATRVAVAGARAEIEAFVGRERSAAAGGPQEWVEARGATYRARGVTEVFAVPEAIVTEAIGLNYRALYVAMDSMALVSQELSSLTRELIVELWDSNSVVRASLVRGAYRVVQAWRRAGASELWRGRRPEVDIHHMVWIGHVYTLRLWRQPEGAAGHDRAGEVMFALLIAAVVDGHAATTERSVFWYRQLVIRMRSSREPMTDYAIAMMASEMIALGAIAEHMGRHDEAERFVELMVWSFGEVALVRPRWAERDWRGVVATTESYCENYRSNWPLMHSERLKDVVSASALSEFAKTALRRVVDPQFV